MKNISKITLAIGFALICSTSFGQTKETTKEVEVKEEKKTNPTPPVEAPDEHQKNEKEVYPQKIEKIGKQEAQPVRHNEEVEIQETKTAAPVEVIVPQKAKPVEEVPFKVKPPMK